MTTTFGTSLFLIKHRIRYAFHMPPNTKDLAINQTMVAYGNRQKATAFARANNSDLLRSLKHLMETRLQCAINRKSNIIQLTFLPAHSINQKRGGCLHTLILAYKISHTVNISIRVYISTVSSIRFQTVYIDWKVSPRRT